MDTARAEDDLRVLDRAEAELEDVERALARLGAGAYATCEACGGPIPAGRLDELPLTRRCADHGAPGTLDPAGT
ncbi:MAG: TraR/DksA C4-type zinc finger protein [Acidimicrobiales bacterium]|jgi:RNA polymerase-binding transcription factor